MLTTKEVAEKLGAAETSVRLWARQGRFPGAETQETPRGSFWLIPDTALAGFTMEKRGPKPKPKPKKKQAAKKAALN